MPQPDDYFGEPLAVGLADCRGLSGKEKGPQTYLRPLSEILSVCCEDDTAIYGDPQGGFSADLTCMSDDAQ